MFLILPFPQVITDICSFWYTATFFKPEKSTLKVRKVHHRWLCGWVKYQLCHLWQSFFFSLGGCTKNKAMLYVGDGSIQKKVVANHLDEGGPSSPYTSSRQALESSHQTTLKRGKKTCDYVNFSNIQLENVRGVVWISLVDFVCQHCHRKKGKPYQHLRGSLLLRRWYEIMALYYVKSILTEISASRQDKRVLQKKQNHQNKISEHMGHATDV